MKIIVWGIRGHMGEWIVRQASADPDLELLGGADAVSDPERKIFSDPLSLPCGADIVIDFSRPAAIDDILSYALANGSALILATTGYDELQLAAIDRAAERVPILRSGNLSLGVTLMTSLVEETAKKLGPAYDVEIVEAHHHRKVDSPSGTANMLLDAVKKGRPDLDRVEYGRHSALDPRKPTDVGMHSIRGGTIVGEHTVLFAGDDEIIEIKHTALSRAIFANGALAAAKKLVKKEPGLYSMKDML